MFFEERAKKQAIEKISEILAQNGILVLGHAENIAGIERFFSRRNIAGCYGPRSQDRENPYRRLARIA